MEVLILLLAALIGKVTPLNFVEDPESKHSCEIGDVVQNGRITCTCTQKYIYECNLKKSLESQPSQRLSKDWACHPNKIYVQETTTCICNYNGTWPHSACGDVFDSLPVGDVVKSKCQPDGYVFIGCNVCRCDSNGLIDKSRCTNNECDESVIYPERRSSEPNNVYGNCESKNWYSLAPCQFCYCLNENKLVCNTGNFKTQNLALGSYHLSICGKDLIREAIELIPDESKSLRYGGVMKTISTTSKPTTLPRPKAENERTNVEFEIDFTQGDQETELSKKKYNPKVQRDKEYPESVQEREDYDIKNQEGSKVDSTQIIPFAEDYQLYSKESKELRSENKDDEEYGNTDNKIDRGLKIPTNPKKKRKYKVPEPETLRNWESLGKQLKDTFPTMLNTVLRMASRKSMVTIDQDSSCVLGSVKTVKCNTCFCLKNSKLLCTNNKCD